MRLVQQSPRLHASAGQLVEEGEDGVALARDEQMALRQLGQGSSTRRLMRLALVQSLGIARELKGQATQLT